VSKISRRKKQLLGGRTMKFEIEAQNMDLNPKWKNLVEKKVKKLERLSKKITQLRVTLIHSRHHLLGSEQVRLSASMPNHSIRIEKTAREIADALTAAFASAEEEIKAVRQTRKGFAKKTGQALIESGSHGNSG
jgi:ribosomal subunit interface protein